MSRRPPLHQIERLKFEDVARIIGVSARTLRKPRVREMLPVEYDLTTGTPYISRHRLIRYLADRGYPEAVYRPLMRPKSAHLLCIGVPAAQRVRLRACRLAPVGGPISLGRKMARNPVRGVLIGVEYLPPGRGEQWAEEIGRFEDRPPLVSLSSYTPPGGLFDLIVDPHADPADVRRMLDSLPAPCSPTRRV